ncbi:MAG: AMP-binding protein, partial [Pseudomonadota bacterium]
DIREIGPTYFFAPPRMFEGLLTNLTIRMEDAGRIKKWLFDTFIAHAKAVSAKLKEGQAPTGMDKFKLWLGELLVYGPLKNTLGMNRIRVGYTAGEAVGADLFEFYRSIGINLKQLYGQTEASVFITQHPHDAVELETVGVPTPGVEIKIADSGEVFYRSPGVFQEYYKNPEATAETKDAEGWVATGDAGFMDERSGQLRILDRAKDVGKLANGALFAPKYIENKLKFFPNIFEAVVFGDGKDSCVAFLNIDLNAVGNWAERNNVAYASYMDLASHPEVLKTMRSHVEETNASLAEDPMLSSCQITRFLVLHKQLDADDGELTRTQKVRRKTIDEKYADLIEALYSGATEAETTTEVTYEDGRKGSISATLKLNDAETFSSKQAAA